MSAKVTLGMCGESVCVSVWDYVCVCQAGSLLMLNPGPLSRLLAVLLMMPCPLMSPNGTASPSVKVPPHTHTHTHHDPKQPTWWAWVSVWLCLCLGLCVCVCVCVCVCTWLWMGHQLALGDCWSLKICPCVHLCTAGWASLSVCLCVCFLHMSQSASQDPVWNTLVPKRELTKLCAVSTSNVRACLRACVCVCRCVICCERIRRREEKGESER